MRCLKRRLSNVVYQQMVNDANAARVTRGSESSIQRGRLNPDS